MKRCMVTFVFALLALCGVGLAFAGPVNINTADAQTLAAELTGVGPALAAAIISDRESNGEFPTPESLMRVRGVGPHILEVNRGYILVKDVPASP